MNISESDLARLNGGNVLVKSAADHRDPPIARRGTIDARLDAAGQPVVKIALDYPDMANRVAEQGVLTLSPAEVERLVAGGHDGLYEFTISGPLEPGAEPTSPKRVE